MTSEVCLMNSLAVVLAADSATTVQYYEKGRVEQRYFKSANKIFQLSDDHAIGLMIYNSASILGVPWEVLIKDFRRELGSKSFNDVNGFADELFDFIQKSQRFFPDSVRREKFCEFAISQGLQELLNIRENLDENKDYNVDEHIRFIKKTDIPTDLPYQEEEIEDLQNTTSGVISSEIAEYHKILEIDTSCLDELVSAIFQNALVAHGNDDNYTGLVFAGFGDHSIFPELVSYKRCEFWGTKFVARLQTSTRVDHNNQAVVEGFAQTSMVDTFVSGISFDAFAKIHEMMIVELREYSDSIERQLGGEISGFDKIEEMKKRIKGFQESLFGYMRTDHDGPLRRVIGFLPVDEMAELAETLINLQSLKEKVTKPSETVGGPVDVAAITRSEGLVWLRRKHFFDPAINSRYFRRQRSLFGADK